MVNKKGQLEVEVIRARGLIQKPGSKSLPGESLLLYYELTARDSNSICVILFSHKPIKLFEVIQKTAVSELVILDLFSNVTITYLICSILFDYSSIRQSLSSTQWGVCSQEEDKNCTQDTRPAVPASTAV